MLCDCIALGLQMLMSVQGMLIAVNNYALTLMGHINVLVKRVMLSTMMVEHAECLVEGPT